MDTTAIQYLKGIKAHEGALPEVVSCLFEYSDEVVYRVILDEWIRVLDMNLPIKKYLGVPVLNWRRIDVAREAGVSKPTVIKSIERLTKNGLIRHVSAGGYRRMGIAISLDFMNDLPDDFLDMRGWRYGNKPLYLPDPRRSLPEKQVRAYIPGYYGEEIPNEVDSARLFPEKQTDYMEGKALYLSDRVRVSPEKQVIENFMEKSRENLQATYDSLAGFPVNLPPGAALDDVISSPDEWSIWALPKKQMNSVVTGSGSDNEVALDYTPEQVRLAIQTSSDSTRVFPVNTSQISKEVEKRDDYTLIKEELQTMVTTSIRQELAAFFNFPNECCPSKDSVTSHTNEHMTYDDFMTTLPFTLPFTEQLVNSIQLLKLQNKIKILKEHVIKANSQNLDYDLLETDVTNFLTLASSNRILTDALSARVPPAPIETHHPHSHLSLVKNSQENLTPFSYIEESGESMIKREAIKVKRTAIVIPRIKRTPIKIQRIPVKLTAIEKKSLKNNEVVASAAEALVQKGILAGRDRNILQLGEYYNYLTRKVLNINGYRSLGNEPKKHKNWLQFSRVLDLCEEKGWDYRLYLEAQFDRASFWAKTKYRSNMPFANQLYSKGAQEYYLKYVEFKADSVYQDSRKIKPNHSIPKTVRQEITEDIKHGLEILAMYQKFFKGNAKYRDIVITEEILKDVLISDVEAQLFSFRPAFLAASELVQKVMTDMEQTANLWADADEDWVAEVGAGRLNGIDRLKEKARRIKENKKLMEFAKSEIIRIEAELGLPREADLLSGF